MWKEAFSLKTFDMIRAKKLSHLLEHMAHSYSLISRNKYPGK